VDRWIVGGPAVKLLPDYLEGLAEYGADDSTVLERVNPAATRTTSGCPNACSFCGVRKISGSFKELGDWPDLPILCDDNLLAANHRHFDRVMDRLERWPSPDFNQGLDANFLTPHHARRIARLNKPVVRLALDHDRDREVWADAVNCLRTAGVAKGRVRSFVLCGFEGGPTEDQERCQFVESQGVMALPMWYHPLDTLEHNPVTDKQRSLGWDHRKRRELMCWYYWHRTLEVRG
jgi:hypothetical protein